MLRFGALTLALFAMTGAAAGCAADDVGSEEDLATEKVVKPARFAPGDIGATKNWKIWKQYCIGDTKVSKKPLPNYKNALVLKAAANLDQVAMHSFALYGDVSAHHRSSVPAAMAGKVKDATHEFLTYLCGEYRDRATMVEAKLRWVGERFNYLDDEESSYDPAGDPWLQMRKQDYHPYLNLSRSLFQAKKSDLVAQGKGTLTIGSITADTPVPPQTVCETKYMFAAYVREGKSFDTLEAFKAGYAQFRDASCTLPKEEDYYYDFRGDSNIKPNSPESNAMIWFSRTIARQCKSKNAAKPYREVNAGAGITSAECLRYYKYPFAMRWNAARAGLASWVLVDPFGDSLDSNSQYTVVPRSIEDEKYLFGDLAPYRAIDQNGTQVQLLPGWDASWDKGSYGLDELFESSQEKMQKAMQLAVDRHTDWYSSGYDDKMPLKPVKNTQAYSPFVASSYEMGASDTFVTPGVTVPVIDASSRNYKHWMFVFRVKKENWYTPENVLAGETPDLERVWLDETSFGDTGLANSERAWDRLGTALEDELDSVLYLHNLPSGGGH